MLKVFKTTKNFMSSLKFIDRNLMIKNKKLLNLSSVFGVVI